MLRQVKHQHWIRTCFLSLFWQDTSDQRNNKKEDEEWKNNQCNQGGKKYFKKIIHSNEIYAVKYTCISCGEKYSISIWFFSLHRIIGHIGFT